MKKKYTLGIIGAGFMSHAIIKGLIKPGNSVIKPKNIMVSDIKQENLDGLMQNGLMITKDNDSVAIFADFVLLAVKPQNFKAVVAGLKNCPKRVISIMAGVTKQTIKDALGGQVKVARCMPNTPCSVGRGAIAVDYEDFDAYERKFIHDIFSSTGDVISVKEDKMNAVTGISGSGPAYVYLFIDSLINAGIKHGLTYDEAKTLAVSTAMGGAEMVIHHYDKKIPELINAVCSKGGTTVEAMNLFEEYGFSSIIEKAVDACVNRAEEISKNA